MGESTRIGSVKRPSWVIWSLTNNSRFMTFDFTLYFFTLFQSHSSPFSLLYIHFLPNICCQFSYNYLSYDSASGYEQQKKLWKIKFHLNIVDLYATIWWWWYTRKYIVKHVHLLSFSIDIQTLSAIDSLPGNVRPWRRQQGGEKKRRDSRKEMEKIAQGWSNY
jgi:hypothetical protein